MSRITTNVGRTILNGIGGRTNEGQESQLRTQASPPTIQRAVVVDVIISPAELTDEYLNELSNLVNNAELLEIMPVNSVVARIVSNNGGVSPQQSTILFPLFSSHIMLPVKPGEHVYAIFEDYGFKNNKLGYWISRPTSPLAVEDANYTHYDRLWDPTSDPANYTTDQLTKRPAQSPPYSFQNGGGTAETVTLSTDGLPDDANPYDVIVKNAEASKTFAPEPVPRWKKRPGELVLQGSNNSLIVLGTDRNGPLADGNEKKSDAGAVDIVVGRGRHKKPAGTYPGDGKFATAPIVANNVRTDGTQGTETDKAPHRTATFPDKGNVKEGDPSPQYDAARLLVTQQSKADENYGISSRSYPDTALAPEQPEAVNALGNSYVVSKADHIRAIARGDDDVKGTLLLIKEGSANTGNTGADPMPNKPEYVSPNSSKPPIPPTIKPFLISENDAADPNGDLAYVYVDKDGNIQIEGKNIFIGRGTDKKEPFVRWTYYNAQIEDLKQQVKALADLVQFLSTTYQLAFESSISIPFTQVPSLLAIARNDVDGTIVNPRIKQIKDNIDAIDQAQAKSKKIFGE